MIGTRSKDIWNKEEKKNFNIQIPHHSPKNNPSRNRNPAPDTRTPHLQNLSPFTFRLSTFFPNFAHPFK
jgi:hypothetical protein